LRKQATDSLGSLDAPLRPCLEGGVLERVRALARRGGKVVRVGGRAPVILVNVEPFFSRQLLLGLQGEVLDCSGGRGLLAAPSGGSNNGQRGDGVGVWGGRYWGYSGLKPRNGRLVITMLTLGSKRRVFAFPIRQNLCGTGNNCRRFSTKINGRERHVVSGASRTSSSAPSRIHQPVWRSANQADQYSGLAIAAKA